LQNKVLQTSYGDEAGHMGVRKTYDCILRYFFWPRLKWDVSQFIKTCDTCQRTSKQNQVVKPAPLYPIPAIGQPFEHLIDCVGPLARSGHSYLLTVMCQATRYPAAFSLRTITSKSVVKALTQFISTFGIPKSSSQIWGLTLPPIYLLRFSISLKLNTTSLLRSMPRARELWNVFIKL
jgi:hypothetical protein